MKKIGFFETAAWEKDWLVKDLGGFALKFRFRPIDAFHLPQDRDFAAISIGESSHLTPEVLAAFPLLEFVAIRSRSFPAEYLSQLRSGGIMASNLPQHAAPAVAEFTFALILALIRRMPDALARSAAGTFHAEGLRGSNLHGKTFGVIGTGNIGQHVIRIAKGFGARVFAWSYKQDMQLAKELGFAYLPLPELTAYSDIVTLHLPYVPPGSSGSTHELLDRDMILNMKSGSYLVNTAHERLSDLGAVRYALLEGKLAGAAFDIADPETAKEFAGCHSMLLTPRAAYNSQETFEDALETTAENIRAYFRGFPQNIIGTTLN